MTIAERQATFIQDMQDKVGEVTESVESGM